MADERVGVATSATAPPGRRRWLPLGLAILGVLLTAVAIVRLNSSFTVDFAVTDAGRVEARCGNAIDAWSLENGDFVTFVVTQGDALAFTTSDVAYAKAHSVNACRDEGDTRVKTSGAMGIAGIVALVAAGILFVRSSKTNERSGHEAVAVPF